MKTFLITLFLLLAACGPAADRPHPRAPSDTPRCPDACAHLRDLDCDEGKPLEDGTTCEGFCQATQDSGHALSPTCVVTIRSCDELNTVCNKP